MAKFANCYFRLLDPKLAQYQGYLTLVLTYEEIFQKNKVHKNKLWKKMFSDNGPLHTALSHCLLLIDSNASFEWLVLVDQSGTRYCCLIFMDILSLWPREWTFSCRFRPANFDIIVISRLNIKYLIYIFFLSFCMFQNSNVILKSILAFWTIPGYHCS